MKRSILAMLICGLPLVPLGAPAAEDTAHDQAKLSATKDTIPTRYLMLPVCRGDVQRVVSAHTLVDARVKDQQGKDIGTVDNLIMDTKTEKILYAVLSLSDSNRLVTIPWSKVRLNRTDGEVRLSGKADDFHPQLNPKLTRRQSPPIAILMKDADKVRDLRSKDGSGAGVGRTPYAHPSPNEESTQEDWSDPGDGLTPYSYFPLTYDDKGDEEGDGAY